MTSATFRPEFDTKTFDAAFAASKLKLASIFTFIGYLSVFAGYLTIFSVCLITVGFLEIRQANMNDFNGLIAVLEQRDGYKDPHLDEALANVHQELSGYRSWIASPVCYDIGGSAGVPKNKDVTESGAQEASNALPKTCAAITETLKQHANQLSLTEDEFRFRQKNLPFYYDQYIDGITQKSPQIIPALRLLDSKYSLLTIWARSPFELIEMFLLVCMGLLGGVISVMRCFVDPKANSPAIAEFFYKPAAGAAISLGVYVLFRAAQLFLGVQNGPTTVSTSIFLLAGLGLASGFCATQALATIESVATRLLRSAGEPPAAPAENLPGSPANRGEANVQASPA